MQHQHGRPATVAPVMHVTTVGQGVLIDLKLSQYEWGTLINASRESVNKQLKAWQSQGLVDIVDGKLLVPEPHVLESLR